MDDETRPGSDEAGGGSIRIVLVEPRHPGNVGAAARAMKTMGLDQLHLVRPVDFPSLEAEQRAVAAADVLDRAHVVDRLADAIHDCSLVIGTGGRDREHAHPVIGPREAAARVTADADAGAAVAIVFGSERDGLSNASMDACGYQLKIPTDEAQPSLNLAAAVQLVCYELLMARQQPAHDAPARSGGEADYPSSDEVEFFFSKLRHALDDREFFGAKNPDPTFTRIRRTLGRSRPDKAELLLLHGLVRLMEKRT